jgi:hypothetical protein
MQSSETVPSVMSVCMTTVICPPSHPLLAKSQRTKSYGERTTLSPLAIQCLSVNIPAEENAQHEPQSY